MPWYKPWSDIIKKKVCRFVLQRYLGQFLEEKLSLEQLNVDFYNGRGTVFNLKLYCNALNELCEGQGWGLEVIGGRIGSVTVNVPWNALMTEDSYIEVTDLNISLRPQARNKDGSSMLESMWSSMSSSMQLAQECLEKDEDIPMTPQGNNMDGLERFAQIIDNVLNRIKAKLINTEIRLEYVPENSDSGIAIIVKVKNIQYQNEAGGDPPDKDDSDDSKKQQNAYSISTYATHHITMEGITFYTEEFRIYNDKKDEKPTSTNLISEDQFASTISNLPDDQNISFTESQCSHSAEESSAKGMEEDEDDDDETTFKQPEIYRTEQIMIGSISNRQEIRIKMKQDENVPGPKVDLEMTFGSIALFLTPRQLHLLLFVSSILLDNDIQLTDEQKKLRRAAAAAASAAAHQNEARDDMTQHFSPMTGGIGINQGWSMASPLDDEYAASSIDHISHSGVSGGGFGMGESVMSSNHSSMSSSMSSSASQSTANKIRKRGIDADPNADISRFNLRVACLALVIIHEDILVECSSHFNESPLSEQSVDSLREKANEFFDIFNGIGAGLGDNDINKLGRTFDGACKNNHLRFLAAPIILESEEQRNVAGNLLRLSVSLARADIREFVQNVPIPLLEFYREEKAGNLPKRPEILLNLKQTQSTVRGRNGRSAGTKLDLKISLAKCQTEFDISIIDRLSSIIFQSPFAALMKIKTPSTDHRNNETKIDIKIDSPFLDFKLRFPIPDLRPIHDPQRVPWWSRNVRPDYILLSLHQANIQINNLTTFDISANEININYFENAKSERINIGKAVLCECTPNRYVASTVEYPRIVIEIANEKNLQELRNRNFQNDDTDSDPTSGESIGLSPPKHKEETPFSSKKACRESDTPHQKQNADDPETMLIPGDREEMNTFCENAMKYAKLLIKLELPVVSLQLKSKHLYEVIYNRITTDLLLWEPSAPSATAPSVNVPMQPDSSTLLNVGMMDSIYAPFTMCKSGINFESSSSATASESDSDSDGIFYSIYDRNKPKKSLVYNQQQYDNTNTVSLRLKIGDGMVTMYAPVRDVQNHVIPEQLGEFVIQVKTVDIFSVNGFHGNSNLGYLCLQAKSAELYHCGLIPVPGSDPPLRVIGCMLPSHLKSTLYPTLANSTLIEKTEQTKRDMISLAVQIKSCPDQNLKRIKVSAGIQDATLKHYSASQQHIWFTQIMDMFDVVDYTVSGYTPLGVITEMHLHLWDCAIDYRPLYLPYRAIATLGSFMISSNITASSSGCTLRFIAEDCTLSLAPQKPLGDCKKRDDTKITCLPASELVCVVEIGLFEISLRINDKVTASFPKFDLRAAINGVHIRTCSDSGRALAQLLAYLAAESDLILPEEDTPEPMSLPMGENEAELLHMKPHISNVPEVTQSQQQRVNTLMAEAMEENMQIVTQSDQSDEPAPGEGVEVFFFPDEETQNKLKNDSHKRRFASSDDSISIEENSSSSYRDEINYTRQYTGSEDTESVNTELRELLDFENSVMCLQANPELEVETLPQVTMDLGDINDLGGSGGGSGSGGNSRNKRASVKSKSSSVARKISSDTDDDFCFIAIEEKPTYNEDLPVSDDPIRIVDNHFSIPTGKPDLLQAPKDFPMANVRYTLCEMSVIWHMYGGHDFPTENDKKGKDNPTRPLRNFTNLPMSEAYKVGVSYSKGSPNVQIGQNPWSKMPLKVRGGRLRKHDVLMEIQLNKVRFSHETYPPTATQSSRQVLLLTELEIRDRLSVSNINKFLYHPTVGCRPKGAQHMIVIKALHLRPDPALLREECCLCISMLPLRLNIDQDSLLFMVNFFNELGGGGDLITESDNPHASPKQNSTPSHQAPVMMVELPEAAQELHARKMVKENLMLLTEQKEEQKDKDNCDTSSEIEDDSPIYFRHIIFSPDVPIRLDYQGKRVELSHGPLAGLLMGLGQLQCSEIRLKKINYRHGILGVDRLFNFLLQEWLQDIKKKQLPKILGGVGPMYSLVQLFQGIWDLFWLPIEQYQKDGRIVRGLQRGAQSFSARTALAALEITTRLIHLLQITAETAYDMVSPGPSVRRIRGNRRGKRKRLQPPQDIREGVNNAYQIVRDGIGETAQTIFDMASREHDQKGYTGAVGAVIRQIPPTVVRPLVLATQATSNVLGGVKNQLVPDAKIEAREKWKEDDE